MPVQMTLLIDDDVAERGRQEAAQRHVSIDAVMSDFARSGMALLAGTEINEHGVRVFSKRGLKSPVTVETVNALRDEEP